MPRYHNINGNIVQFTAEEETARDNEEAAWANAAPARALADLRSKRDNLLKVSDWEIIQELEKGNAISDEMKTYRQALRDLPNGKDTVDKCNNATWPTKP
jgi:hypothetical protein